MHPRLLRCCANFCLSLSGRPSLRGVTTSSAFLTFSPRRYPTTTSMSQQQQSSNHTAANIRAKRLAALEGRAVSTMALAATLQQQPPRVAAMNEAVDERTRAAAVSMQDDQSRRLNPNKTEVIDICDSDDDDDDDDDDKKASGNGRKRKQPETNHDARSSNSKLQARESSSIAASSQSAATAASSLSQSFSSSPSSCTFRLTTYNVWFGPNGDANPHCDARMKAIARLVKAEPQTLLAGFQEVTDTSLPVLASAMKAAGYETIVQTNGAPYFCVLAVRQLARDSPLLDGGWRCYRQSQMGRGFCYARLRLPDGQCHDDAQMIVATTHLESWTGAASTGARERVAQLVEFAQWARQEMQAHPQIKWAVIMGDLNWDDESRKPNDTAMAQVLSDCGMPFQDTWLAVQQKKSEKCYTYDARDNPMLGGSLRRRFDRTIIFARDEVTNQQLKVLSTKLIGTEALPGLTFQKLNTYTQSFSTKPVAPSDHFGFVSEVKIDV